MKFPDEIVVQHYVPTVRALLVRALEKRGLNQTEIAERVGVTQSAVSKYALGKLAADPLLARDPRVLATVERVAEGLAVRAMSAMEALAALMDLLRELENRGPICAIHEREMPALQGTGCDLCVRGARSEVLAEQAVLASVRRAVQVLVATPDLVAFLPHVGTNVAEALPNATDASRVAAVPGGLFEMRGMVRVPAPPEFGVSKHVAEVALAAAAAMPGKRAALNLAVDARLLAAARAEGLAVIEVPPAIERRPRDLAAALAGHAADVVHHPGDFGIEPQAYVLASDAVAAAETARRLVARASSLPVRART